MVLLSIEGQTAKKLTTYNMPEDGCIRPKHTGLFTQISE
jgi:hypothetical protein